MSSTNGAVAGKGQVRVCPKHGPIIVAGPHAKPPVKHTLAKPSINNKNRPVSVTVSQVSNRNEKGAVPVGTIVSVTPETTEPKIHKDRADAPSSTYRAFTSVDDNMLSSQDRDTPTIVCIDGRPMSDDLKGGRHCIPGRPISEDILGTPWIRKPIAVKLGSVSAPNSPQSAVKLQRVSPQRARIFPPDLPNPIQRPVAQRQARRIADPKSGSGSNSTSMQTYNPWIKGPELKPVTNVTEILTMETNVDGYVAKTS